MSENFGFGNSYPLLKIQVFPLTLKEVKPSRTRGGNNHKTNEEDRLDISYRPEESMKALVQLGTTGYFPLFTEVWLKESGLNEKKFQKITGFERARAKKLFQKVSKYPHLEHKKLILLSMNEDDRKLFMKAFFKMVEGKILDQRMELH